METTIASITATLKELSGKYKSRAGFNKAVGCTYKRIGEGAFRIVYAADDYVIKLRRSVKRRGDDWTSQQITEGNSSEHIAYQTMLENAPSLAFFALAPVYLVLDNRHDAIIMPRVSTHSEDEHFNLVDAEEGGIGLDEYTSRFFTRIMRDQYSFINNNFGDSHCGNIGWDMKAQRVWFIDLNFEHNDDYCRLERKASKLVEKVSTATKQVA